MSEPVRLPFEYAVLRVVPRIERGEIMNAGVVLYCPAAEFLGAAVALDEPRLRALDRYADVEMVAAALAAVSHTCDGSSGRAVAEDRGRRFRWLTAPRSTVVQPGPVHTGFTADPAAELARLVQLLVAPPAG